MASGDILSDFGINLLEEEIDDVIFQTNEFLTDATFTGSQGPNVYGTRGLVCNRHGSRHGVQDDGQERTAGYHEVVQAIGDFNYPMLVVSSGRHGYGKQWE